MHKIHLGIVVVLLTTAVLTTASSRKSLPSKETFGDVGYTLTEGGASLLLAQNLPRISERLLLEVKGVQFSDLNAATAGSNPCNTLGLGDTEKTTVSNSPKYVKSRSIRVKHIHATIGNRTSNPRSVGTFTATLAMDAGLSQHVLIRCAYLDRTITQRLCDGDVQYNGDFTLALVVDVRRNKEGKYVALLDPTVNGKLSASFPNKDCGHLELLGGLITEDIEPELKSKILAAANAALKEEVDSLMFKFNIDHPIPVGKDVVVIYRVRSMEFVASKYMALRASMFVNATKDGTTVTFGHHQRHDTFPVNWEAQSDIVSAKLVLSASGAQTFVNVAKFLNRQKFVTYENVSDAVLRISMTTKGPSIYLPSDERSTISLVEQSVKIDVDCLKKSNHTEHIALLTVGAAMVREDISLNVKNSKIFYNIENINAENASVQLFYSDTVVISKREVQLGLEKIVPAIKPVINKGLDQIPAPIPAGLIPKLLSDPEIIVKDESWEIVFSNDTTLTMPPQQWTTSTARPIKSSVPKEPAAGWAVLLWSIYALTGVILLLLSYFLFRKHASTFEKGYAGQLRWLVAMSLLYEAIVPCMMPLYIRGGHQSNALGTYVLLALAVVAMMGAMVAIVRVQRCLPLAERLGYIQRIFVFFFSVVLITIIAVDWQEMKVTRIKMRLNVFGQESGFQQRYVQFLQAEKMMRVILCSQLFQPWAYPFVMVLKLGQAASSARINSIQPMAVMVFNASFVFSLAFGLIEFQGRKRSESKFIWCLLALFCCSLAFIFAFRCCRSRPAKYHNAWTYRFSVPWFVCLSSLSTWTLFELADESSYLSSLTIAVFLGLATGLRAHLDFETMDEIDDQEEPPATHAQGDTGPHVHFQEDIAAQAWRKKVAKCAISIRNGWNFLIEKNADDDRKISLRRFNLLLAALFLSMNWFLIELPNVIGASAIDNEWEQLDRTIANLPEDLQISLTNTSAFAPVIETLARVNEHVVYWKCVPLFFLTLAFCADWQRSLDVSRLCMLFALLGSLLLFVWPFSVDLAAIDLPSINKLHDCGPILCKIAKEQVAQLLSQSMEANALFTFGSLVVIMPWTIARIAFFFAVKSTNVAKLITQVMVEGTLYTLVLLTIIPAALVYIWKQNQMILVQYALFVLLNFIAFPWLIDQIQFMESSTKCTKYLWYVTWGVVFYLVPIYWMYQTVTERTFIQGLIHDFHDLVENVQKYGWKFVVGDLLSFLGEFCVADVAISDIMLTMGIVSADKNLFDQMQALRQTPETHLLGPAFSTQEGITPITAAPSSPHTGSLAAFREAELLRPAQEASEHIGGTRIQNKRFPKGSEQTRVS
jgi:hypothetical protein